MLARGGQVVQKASEIDTVVFDKTGTLTSGEFEIVEVLAGPGRSEAQVLALGATAEAGSDHPLAKVIVRSATWTRGSLWEHPRTPGSFRGGAPNVVYGGQVLRAGNEAFLQRTASTDFRDSLEAADRAGATPVLIAEGSRFAGAILLRDTPKPVLTTWSMRSRTWGSRTSSF